LGKEKPVNTSIHAGHRNRVKERVKDNSIDKFSDHALLEILLFFAITRKDTNETAHKLINEFGSLEGVFKAPYDALLRVEGVGEKTALLIRVVSSIFDRIRLSSANNNKEPMTTDRMKEYLASYYRSKIYETIVILSFDNKGRIKKLSVVGEGSINSTDINSRKIVETSINSNASYIVLAHNHPNGAASPSLADIDATRSLVVMLRRLDIGVYDHIIIGADGDAFSMRKHAEYKNMFI